MRIKSILVLLLLMMFVKVSLAGSSEDLKKLKEIARAIKAHRKMIKTGTGDVSSYRKDFRTGRSAERHGKWWFKNGVWRFDCEDFQWNPVRTAEGRWKEKTMRKAELRDGILLDFIADEGFGSITENMMTGIQGLFFIGITGYNSCSYSIEDTFKAIEKGKNKIIYSLEDVKYEGKRCKLISSTFEPQDIQSYIKVWICPEEQYSYIRSESWMVMKSTGKPGNGEINKIAMEYIDPPGIWFPREATFQRYLSFPQKLIQEERYIFSNTRLNIPITDEEITVKLPSGSRITNMVNREVYHRCSESDVGEIYFRTV